MFENRFVQSWPFRVNILGLVSIDVQLNAVAVVLGFVKPLRPYRSHGIQGGPVGFNEPRHLDFATHGATHKKTSPTAAEERRRLPLSQSLSFDLRTDDGSFGMETCLSVQFHFENGRCMNSTTDRGSIIASTPFFGFLPKPLALSAHREGSEGRKFHRLALNKRIHKSSEDDIR